MVSAARDVEECLGALEASVTYFACEDFEDLVATFGSTFAVWRVEDSDLGEIVRICQRFYSVLKLEGATRALLTQCDVSSRLCKHIQRKMFNIYARSIMRDGLDTSQQWVLELRMVHRELANMSVSLIQRVESMSTLDSPLDIDAFKAIRSTVHQVDMIVGIVDAAYDPLSNVETYFDSVIDLPMTKPATFLNEIALAFQMAGKELPRKIRDRLSGNEALDRR